MSKFVFPAEALDDRLAVTGTAGSGKTYGAGVLVEKLLATNARVVIPDPLGVWHGLRLGADGKSPGFPVVIFGGEHGDLPLTESAGALIGETVAGMAESVILDLTGLGTKAAERRFMLAFLTALYRKTNREPVHVVFDEADMWAPQNVSDKDGGSIQLLGMMETICRRGRIKGFVPWLITQRPAVLNKNVLSQADGLIAFKLTSPQDRKALGDWVSDQAEPGEAKRILGDMPTLARGEAVVWLPGHSVLSREQFPTKITFDSSRTPLRGESKRRLALKPLDLGALREKLATVEETAKANDPAKLRAEVARLTKALSISAPSNEAAKVDTAAIEAAEKNGFARGHNAMQAKALAAVEIIRPRLAEAASILDSAISWITREFTEAPLSGPVAAPAAAQSTQPAPAKRTPARPAVPAGILSSAATKMLDARRTHRGISLTWDELCVLSGLIPGNGYFYGGKKELVTGGYIAEDCSLLKDEPGGHQMTVADVATLWSSKLKQPGPIMLAHLLTRRPTAVDQADLAAATNLKPGNGYWYGGLKALRKAGLIMEGNPVSLTAILIDGRLAP